MTTANEKFWETLNINKLQRWLLFEYYDSIDIALL
jgi:hypothetical protein